MVKEDGNVVWYLAPKELSCTLFASISNTHTFKKKYILQDLTVGQRFVCKSSSYRKNVLYIARVNEKKSTKYKRIFYCKLFWTGQAKKL